MARCHWNDCLIAPKNDWYGHGTMCALILRDNVLSKLWRQWTDRGIEQNISLDEKPSPWTLSSHTVGLHLHQSLDMVYSQKQIWMLYQKSYFWWHYEDHGRIIHISLSSIWELDHSGFQPDIQEVCSFTALLLARKHWLYCRGPYGSWKGILHVEISWPSPSFCLYCQQTYDFSNKWTWPFQSDTGFQRGSSHRQPSVRVAKV